MTSLRRLAESRFFRGVVAIAGGTAVAQAVGILLSPIITRLYTPEAMGLWGLFVSFLGVAAVVSTLRYEVAIVAASSEEDALALTRSSLVLGIFTGLFSALILEVMRRNDVLGYGHLPAWVSLLAFPAVVAFAWGTALRYYSVRKGAFGLVGRFTVTQGVARPFAQTLFSPFGSAGLLLGEVAGRLLGLTALWRALPKNTGPKYSATVLSKYLIFPMIQLPSGFLDTMALMAPVPVFTALYGASFGGGLALAQRVMGIPLSLIGASVADVFYNRAAELSRNRSQKLFSFFVATTAYLFTLAVLFGLFSWFVMPKLVPWVFGREWSETSYIYSSLAPWYAAMLVVSPLSRVLALSKHMWIKLIYDGVSIIVVSSPLWLRMSSPAQALLLVSVAKAFQLLFYYALITWLVLGIQKEYVGWEK